MHECRAGTQSLNLARARHGVIWQGEAQRKALLELQQAERRIEDAELDKLRQRMCVAPPPPSPRARRHTRAASGRQSTQLHIQHAAWHCVAPAALSGRVVSESKIYFHADANAHTAHCHLPTSFAAQPQVLLGHAGHGAVAAAPRAHAALRRMASRARAPGAAAREGARGLRR